MEENHQKPTPITASKFIFMLKQTKKWRWFLFVVGNENNQRDKRERESEWVFGFAFALGADGGICWICERYTQKLLHSLFWHTVNYNMRLCMGVQKRETKGDPGSSVRGTLVGFSNVRWTIRLCVKEGVVWCGGFFQCHWIPHVGARSFGNLEITHVWTWQFQFHLSQKPRFPTHSLQIYCLGFFGLKSISLSR